MSANTGRAPSALTALPVAMNVNAGTITSSPAFTPQACSPSSSASVPEASPTRVAHAAGLGDFPLQRFALRPEHELLRGQHFLDGGANFGRDGFELRSQVEHRNHFHGRARRRGHRGFERSCR